MDSLATFGDVKVLCNGILELMGSQVTIEWCMYKDVVSLQNKSVKGVTLQRIDLRLVYIKKRNTNNKANKEKQLKKEGVRLPPSDLNLCLMSTELNTKHFLPSVAILEACTFCAHCFGNLS